jgi:hypothetical protein
MSLTDPGQELMVSQLATPFMNATFGWPVLPSVDMRADGPACPLSSLGVRLRAKPSDAWTVLAGVFDGNRAGSDVGDPQKQNSHGTNFNSGPCQRYGLPDHARISVAQRGDHSRGDLLVSGHR